MGDMTPISSSLYWFPQSEEQVPLKRWYEGRTLSLADAGMGNDAEVDDDIFNGGIAGHGLGFSRVLAGLPRL